MDTKVNNLPEKDGRYLSDERRTRKTARTNRAPTGKGILVNPGENIQKAIDAVEKDGDGVVSLVTGTHSVDYNITLPQGLTLKGAGSQGATIIDFSNGAYSIKIQGIVGNNVLNCSIQDLLIKRSTADAAIDLQYAQQVRVINVVISSCTKDGFRIRNSGAIDCERILVDSCRDGIIINGSSSDDVFAVRFYSCTSQNNSQNGFYVNTGGADAVQNIWFFGCRAGDNTKTGFAFAGGAELNSGLINCEAVDNSIHGFSLAAEDISVIGCNAKNNTQVGFLNNDSDNRIIGCSSEGSGIRDYHIALQSNAGQLIGNNTRPGATQDPSTELSDPDSYSNIDLGENGTWTTQKTVLRMKNNSGGERSEGETAVWDTSTSGNQFTTTTTQGDDKVVGMIMETIANGQWGYILVLGKTTKLKVNGTTDIAAGDLLGTFTSAGIAMKAAAGDMAFAMSLEAYATDDSNGVINALLISPRKV